MKAWRLLDSGPGPAAWNLAVDDAIFACVRARRSPPTLRLYSWERPALSLGYAQDLDRDVDLAACRERGIPVVRRASGGRAVLHDRELTYSVAVADGTLPFGATLDGSCRAVAAGIVAGLRRLGVPAQTGVPARSPARLGRDPSCFASVGRHEIVVGGRKLVGSAQRRSGAAFLQHGSILVEGREALLSRLLRHSRQGVGRTVGLADVLRPCPAHAAIAAAVAAGCAAAWGVGFVTGNLSVEENLIAREREASRYGAASWNAARRS